MEAWLSNILSAGGAFLISFLAWLTSRKTAKTSEITANAEVEKKASDMWKELTLQFQKDLENTKEESKEALSELRTETAERISKLEAQVKHQGEREARTREDLDRVYTWIENGMTPPIPERPIYLTRERRPPWSRPDY